MPPKNKKTKDFEKQKLKVGKRKPENSNATNTSFTAKTLVLPSQLRQPSLSTYLALLRHHQAPTRRQALANIAEIIHLHEHAAGDIIRNTAPLMVDEDRQVRIGLTHFLRKIQSQVLASHIKILLVHVHAAMTHITPAIRADSTQFLDILLDKSPSQTTRLGFAKTLRLFFPLLGWPMEGTTQAGSVSTSLAFGKLAGKARAQHLASLLLLLQRGLEPDQESVAILFHPDTRKFMIPEVGNPFALDVADDADARREALSDVQSPLQRNLELAVGEGGEVGRLASKLSHLVT